MPSPLPEEGRLSRQVEKATDEVRSYSSYPHSDSPSAHRSGLTDAERDFLANRVLGDEYVIDTLTLMRADRMPIDPNYSDEEVEASAAYRKAKPGVENDLCSLLRPGPS